MKFLASAGDGAERFTVAVVRSMLHLASALQAPRKVHVSLPGRSLADCRSPPARRDTPAPRPASAAQPGPCRAPLLRNISRMLILLSPAKNLDFGPSPPDLARSAPELATHAARIAKAASRLSQSDLMRLMDISEKLAALNVDRFRAFAPAPSPETGKQAILAFNGEVYQGLAANAWSHEDLEWSQDRLRILSGLYGVLRPLDAIQPYRLEMGTSFAPGRASDLYAYWRSVIAPVIARDLDRLGGPRIVINLASDEYARAVDFASLNARVITPSFRDVKDGVARSVFLFIKRARGEMARWIVQTRIEDVEAVRAFSWGGYRLDEAQSTQDRWTFIRPQPKPIARSGTKT